LTAKSPTPRGLASGYIPNFAAGRFMTPASRPSSRVGSSGGSPNATETGLNQKSAFESAIGSAVTSAIYFALPSIVTGFANENNQEAISASLKAGAAVNVLAAAISGFSKAGARGAVTGALGASVTSGVLLSQASQVKTGVREQVFEKARDKAVNGFNKLTENISDLTQTISDLESQYADPNARPEALIKLAKKEQDLLKKISLNNPEAAALYKSAGSPEEKQRALATAKDAAQKEASVSKTVLDFAELDTAKRDAKAITSFFSELAGQLDTEKVDIKSLSAANFNDFLKRGGIEKTSSVFSGGKGGEDLTRYFIDFLKAQEKRVTLNKEAESLISEIKKPLIELQSSIESSQAVRSASREARGGYLENMSRFSGNFGERAAIESKAAIDRYNLNRNEKQTFFSRVSSESKDLASPALRSLVQSITSKGPSKDASDSIKSLIADLKKSNPQSKDIDKLQRISTQILTGIKKAGTFDKIIEAQSKFALKALTPQERLSFGGGIKTSIDASSKIDAFKNTQRGALQYQLGSMFGSKETQIGGLTNFATNLKEKYAGLFEGQSGKNAFGGIADQLTQLRAFDIRQSLSKDAMTARNIGQFGLAGELENKLNPMNQGEIYKTARLQAEQQLGLTPKGLIDESLSEADRADALDRQAKASEDQQIRSVEKALAPSIDAITYSFVNQINQLQEPLNTAIQNAFGKGMEISNATLIAKNLDLGSIIGGKNAPETNEYRNAPITAEERAARKAELGLAGGFIPNFSQSAISDAVNREKTALTQRGIPASVIGGSVPNFAKINIEQSNKLMNRSNPMGFAVTNSVDEPNGLASIGLASGGFIPNFADDPKAIEAFKNALIQTLTDVSQVEEIKKFDKQQVLAAISEVSESGGNKFRYISKDSLSQIVKQIQPLAASAGLSIENPYLLASQAQSSKAITKEEFIPKNFDSENRYFPDPKTKGTPRVAIYLTTGLEYETATKAQETLKVQETPKVQEAKKEQAKSELIKPSIAQAVPEAGKTIKEVIAEVVKKSTPKAKLSKPKSKAANLISSSLAQSSADPSSSIYEPGATNFERLGAVKAKDSAKRLAEERNAELIKEESNALRRSKRLEKKRNAELIKQRSDALIRSRAKRFVNPEIGLESGQSLLPLEMLGRTKEGRFQKSVETFVNESLIKQKQAADVQKEVEALKKGPQAKSLTEAIKLKKLNPEKQIPLVYDSATQSFKPSESKPGTGQLPLFEQERSGGSVFGKGLGRYAPAKGLKYLSLAEQQEAQRIKNENLNIKNELILEQMEKGPFEKQYRTLLREEARANVSRSNLPKSSIFADSPEESLSRKKAEASQFLKNQSSLENLILQREGLLDPRLAPLSLEQVFLEAGLLDPRLANKESMGSKPQGMLLTAEEATFQKLETSRKEKEARRRSRISPTVPKFLPPADPKFIKPTVLDLEGTSPLFKKAGPGLLFTGSFGAPTQTTRDLSINTTAGFNTTKALLESNPQLAKSILGDNFADILRSRSAFKKWNKSQGETIVGVKNDGSSLIAKLTETEQRKASQAINAGLATAARAARAAGGGAGAGGGLGGGAGGAGGGFGGGAGGGAGGGFGGGAGGAGGGFGGGAGGGAGGGFGGGAGGWRGAARAGSGPGPSGNYFKMRNQSGGFGASLAGAANSAAAAAAAKASSFATALGGSAAGKMAKKYLNVTSNLAGKYSKVGSNLLDTGFKSLGYFSQKDINLEAEKLLKFDQELLKNKTISPETRTSAAEAYLEKLGPFASKVRDVSNQMLEKQNFEKTRADIKGKFEKIFDPNTGKVNLNNRIIDPTGSDVFDSVTKEINKAISEGRLTPEQGAKLQSKIYSETFGVSPNEYASLLKRKGTNFGSLPDYLANTDPAPNLNDQLKAKGTAADLKRLNQTMNRSVGYEFNPATGKATPSSQRSPNWISFSDFVLQRTKEINENPSLTKEEKKTTIEELRMKRAKDEAAAKRNFAKNRGFEYNSLTGEAMPEGSIVEASKARRADRELATATQENRFGKIGNVGLGLAGVAFGALGAYQQLKEGNYTEGVFSSIGALASLPEAVIAKNARLQSLVDKIGGRETLGKIAGGAFGIAGAIGSASQAGKEFAEGKTGQGAYSTLQGAVSGGAGLASIAGQAVMGQRLFGVGAGLGFARELYNAKDNNFQLTSGDTTKGRFLSAFTGQNFEGEAGKDQYLAAAGDLAGTAFTYGMGGIGAGVAVAKLGYRFGNFLEQEVDDFLGMSDTASKYGTKNIASRKDFETVEDYKKYLEEEKKKYSYSAGSSIFNPDSYLFDANRLSGKSVSFFSKGFIPNFSALKEMSAIRNSPDYAGYRNASPMMSSVYDDKVINTAEIETPVQDVYARMFGPIGYSMKPKNPNETHAILNPAQQNALGYAAGGFVPNFSMDEFTSKITEAMQNGMGSYAGGSVPQTSNNVYLNDNRSYSEASNDVMEGVLDLLFKKYPQEMAALGPKITKFK
jgi:hypothetical protein